MAKAIELYTGHNSYGFAVEVAQREDGVWFSRGMERNRFGTSWSRWTRMSEAPTHPKVIPCRVETGNAPTEIVLTKAESEERIEYGFSILTKCEPGRVRLPNPSYAPSV